MLLVLQNEVVGLTFGHTAYSRRGMKGLYQTAQGLSSVEREVKMGHDVHYLSGKERLRGRLADVGGMAAETFTDIIRHILLLADVLVAPYAVQWFFRCGELA